MMQRSPVLTVFLTVFLDMLGVGIVIPVLPALFIGTEHNILPPGFDAGQRSILYGYLIASYPLFQFFGAPVLGALSDRHGRKGMLQISLVGTFIGYLLFGWSILTGNLVLLFISRMLPGFTGGNISIIMSSLSDIATPENRTKYFGLVGMAFGLGFILGPAIGGFLADKDLVSWFNYATPFWFTAGLTVINIIVVQVLFQETLKEKRSTPVNIFSGFRNIRRALASPTLGRIFAVSLLLSLGFSFFAQFFSVFMIQKFAYTERQIGILFAWVGFWLVFTQGFTVRKLATRFKPVQILRWSIPLLAVAIIAVILPGQAYWIYTINPLIATFQGLTSPNLTTLVSTSAGREEQGEIFGINQSMMAVGQMVPPIIAGYLNNLNGALPMVAAGILIAIAWLVFMSKYRA